MTEQRLQLLENWASAQPSEPPADAVIGEILRELIAEVRRLQQQEQQWQGWQESKMILLNSEMALCAERDAALAERDALKKEARRTQHEYVREMGFTNAYIKRCHALTAQLTEARRVLREVAAMLECHDKYRHYCPNCDRSVGTDDLMAKIAAVLAQDTDA